MRPGKRERRQQKRAALLDKIEHASTETEKTMLQQIWRKEHESNSSSERKRTTPSALSQKQAQPKTGIEHLSTVMELANECTDYGNLFDRARKHAELKVVKTKVLKRLASIAWNRQVTLKERREAQKNRGKGKADAMGRAILSGFESNRKRH